MRVKIESVSKSQGGVKLSFNTSNVGDIVIPLEEYVDIGRPTPFQVVEITIISKDEY